MSNEKLCRFTQSELEIIQSLISRSDIGDLISLSNKVTSHIHTEAFELEQIERVRLKHKLEKHYCGSYAIEETPSINDMRRQTLGGRPTIIGIDKASGQDQSVKLIHCSVCGRSSFHSEKKMDECRKPVSRGVLGMGNCTGTML